jgi:uncharacterized RDD family membrane protein YckC
LARRLACFVYEGVLLFGVVFLSGWLFSTLAQQRHALAMRHGLQAFLFLAIGIYFVWFWTHGGQTVAMKTWHIRLVDAAGRPVTQARALARYIASWVWFVPALLVLWWGGWRGGAPAFWVLTLGVAGYALLALLRADRQFPHDAWCGTRLADVRPARSSG